MSGWQLQDLDLRERGDDLRRLDPRGALLLGCRSTPDVEDDLRDRGALVFPAVPDVPFDPYRAHLYTPDELYDGLAHRRLRRHPRRPGLRLGAAHRPTTCTRQLAQALHDLAVDDALDELRARPRGWSA